MRIFLAINFSSEIRERVWEAFAPVRNGSYPLRWVAPELIHLTLKFLGNVEDVRMTDITEGVRKASVGARPFDLVLNGVGMFPNPSRPRVLFTVCEPSPPLEILQDGIERAMAELGFPLEGRAFRPHLTMARARNNAPDASWSEISATTERVQVAEVTRVTSVDVVESKLTSSGPEYFIRESVTLEA